MKLEDKGRVLLKVFDADLAEDGSFEIPNGVTKIYLNAFLGCSNRLHSVTIPLGIVTIPRGAFRNCKELLAIHIPNTVTSIDANTFNYCRGLQTIALHKGITSIGIGAFYGCIRLEKFIIPESVVSIGASAFKNCSSLKSVTIPLGVTVIASNTFSGCTRLQSIALHPGITSIAYGAFFGCLSLQSITLPEGLTSIDRTAFDGCSNLNTIVIASKDEATLKRITALLPSYLQAKVIPMELANEAVQTRETLFARICKTAETNPLFRFFNQNAGYGAAGVAVKDRRALPNTIFQAMNPFITTDSIYYKKAQMLMFSVPLPKSKEELEVYKKKLESIALECISKAKELNTHEVQHSLFLQHS